MFFKNNKYLIISGILFFAGSFLYAREDKDRVLVTVKDVQKDKVPAVVQPKKEKTQVEYDSKKETLIQSVMTTIDYLSKTVKSLPNNSPQRLKIMMKILTLSMDQATFLTSKENYFYDQKWDKWDKEGKKSAEPKADWTNSSKYWKKLNEQAGEIVALFPTYSELDKVYYIKALGNEFSGNEIKAVEDYNYLVTKYPKSALSGDAYFSMGEYYFNVNNFRNAAINFKKVSSYRDSKNYGWSLYKFAWSTYNLQNYEESLASWKAAVIFSSEKNDNGSNDRLKHESLRDLMYAYTEIGDVQGAIKFYKKYGDDIQLSKTLLYMGQTYASQGKNAKAVETFEAILKEIPNSSQAYDAYAGIIDIKFTERKFEEVWPLLSEINNKFGSKTQWYKKINSELSKDFVTKLYDLVFYYPKKIHQIAQKESDEKLFEDAKHGYLTFLKVFPEAKDKIEVLEYLGDIYYFLKKYKDAGGYYAQIVNIGIEKAVVHSPSGDVNIHNRSASNMLDAYSKDFMSEYAGLIKIKPDFTKEPRPLSETAHNFIGSCDNYLKWYPKDLINKKNCDIYKSEIYYRSADKPKAKEALWDVALSYPGSKEGILAVENFIPLNLENKKDMQEKAKKLIQMDAYSKSSIAKKLLDLLRAFEIDFINDEKNDIKKAERFETFVRQNPNDPDSDKIWFNLSNQYLESGKIEKALNGYSYIFNNYPKSEGFKVSLTNLAKIYDALYDSVNATIYYQKYITLFPKDPDVPAMHQRICRLKMAFDFENSLEPCLQFSRVYKDNGKIIFEKIIEIASRMQKIEILKTVITKYYFPNFNLNLSDKFLAIQHLVDLVGLDKLDTSIKSMYLSLLKGALTGEALRRSSEVIFNQAQKSFEDQILLKLKGDSVENLQSSIQQIYTGLQHLEKIYGQVIQRKEATFGAISFLRLSKAYESFSDQLKNPPTINGAAHEQVVAQLAETETGIRAKNVEYLNLAIKTALDFKIFHPEINTLITMKYKNNGQKMSFEDWIVTPDLVSTRLFKYSSN